MKQYFSGSYISKKVEGRFNYLLATRIFFFGIVALAFPIATYLVYGIGTDRSTTSDYLSFVYSFGLILGMSTAFWPLPSLRHWKFKDRLESLVLVYLGMSYITHLTWELTWLVFYEEISLNPDAFWSYIWWGYIDGGDMRYANPSINIIVMELLSVCNGLVGLWALTTYYRSKRTSKLAVLIMGATAVVHLYSTSLYYLSEILAGMPNVNTDSFIATYIKFGLVNSPWFIVPWFVFLWVKNKLIPR